MQYPEELGRVIIPKKPTAWFHIPHTILNVWPPPYLNQEWRVEDQEHGTTALEMLWLRADRLCTQSPQKFSAKDTYLGFRDYGLVA